MIPVLLAFLFLIVVFGLFWYLFRGLNYDENPIWGNVLASGLNIVFCGLFAIWFFQGNIVDPQLGVSDQYIVPSYGNLSFEDMASVSTNQYQIGDGGSGMYVMSQVENATPGQGGYLSNVTAKVYHHRIYYIQFQDIPLFLLFIGLAVISAILFVWFSWNAKKIWEEAKQYDKEHPEDEEVT